MKHSATDPEQDLLIHCSQSTQDPEELAALDNAQARQDNATNPDQWLQTGEPIRAEIAGGSSHNLFLELPKRGYAHIRVEQLDADVELCLYGPTGRQLTHADSPTDRSGYEQVFILAPLDGVFRLQINSRDPVDHLGAFEAVLLKQQAKASSEQQDQALGSWDFNRAEKLLNKGQKDEALALYQSAISRARRAGDPSLEGRALREQAKILRRQDTARALRDMQRAVSLFSQTEETRELAITQGEVGGIRRLQGDLADAYEIYIGVLEQFRSLSDPLGEATTLNNLGLVEKRRGRTHQALGSYQEAAELWRQLERPKYLLSTEINIGRLLVTLGKLEQAQTLLQGSLQRAQALDDRSRQGWCLTTLGDIAQRLGQHTDAQEHLEEALRIRREAGNQHGEAVTRNSLGNAYLKQGKLEEARQHYLRALELFEQSDDTGDIAMTLLNLGRYHYEKEEYAEAAELHRQALPLFRNSGNRSGEAATLLGEARAAYHLGDLSLAEQRIRASLAIVETLREGTLSPDLRSAVVATKAEYWELYVHIVMRRHEREPQEEYDLRALEISERWRARSLCDLLAETEIDLEEGLPSELLEKERSIRRQIEEQHLLRLELAGSAPGDSKGDSTRAEEIDAQLLRLELELQQTQSQIRGDNPRYADLVHLEPITTREIQDQLLRSNTRLIEYFLGEERSYAWVVTRDRVHSIELPPRAVIEETARNFATLLKSHHGSLAARRKLAAKRLAELVLDPLTAQLADLPNDGIVPALDVAAPPRLLIVGDELLGSIPFAALPLPRASERLLLDDYEITQLPSASVLRALRRRGRQDGASREPRIAVFADPVYGRRDERSAVRTAVAPRQGVAPRDSTARDSAAQDSTARDSAAQDSAPRSQLGEEELGAELSTALRDLQRGSLARLAHTGLEAEAISELFPASAKHLSTGFEASRERILRMDLRPFSILHFAAHGVLNRQHPNLSGLVLSLLDEQGDVQDGFLRLQDIYSLQLEADLVVLSACQTGLGKLVRGEGLVNLTRGFMYAGAQRVLVSLWRVDDAATAELMRRFYRYLFGLPGTEAEDSPATPLSVSAALRRAQLSMRSEPRWSNPYYWAGFVAQGEPRRPPGLYLDAEDIGQDSAGTVEQDDDSDQDMPVDGTNLGESGTQAGRNGAGEESPTDENV